MNDRMNESLSALVDGEADELEVRRVLNEIEDDEELRERWSRYQMMGALMREEPAMTVDLSKGIMQAIDGVPMDEVPAREQGATAIADVAESTVSRSWKQGWIASGAVAASVTLAVLLGVRVVDNSMLGSATVAQNTASEAMITAPAVAGSDVIPAVMPVNADVIPVAGMVVADAANNEPELSEEQLRDAQNRLQEYVLQHSEHAVMNSGRGLMPFARVTNFEQDGDAQ